MQELSDGYDSLIYIGIALLLVIVLLAFVLIKYQLGAPPSSSKRNSSFGRGSLLAECQENMVKNQDL